MAKNTEIFAVKVDLLDPSIFKKVSGEDGDIAFQLTKSETAEATFKRIRALINNNANCYLFTIGKTTDYQVFSVYESYVGSTDMKAIDAFVEKGDKPGSYKILLPVKHFYLASTYWTAVTKTAAGLRTNLLQAHAFHSSTETHKDYTFNGSAVEPFRATADMQKHSIFSKLQKDDKGSWQFDDTTEAPYLKRLRKEKASVCKDLAMLPENVSLSARVTAFGQLRFEASSPHEVRLSSIVRITAQAEASQYAGLDKTFIQDIVRRLTQTRLVIDDNIRDREDQVVLAIPSAVPIEGSDDETMLQTLLDIAFERMKKGLATYILVPILSKNWSVCGLYVNGDTALRIFGNPIWSGVDASCCTSTIDVLFEKLFEVSMSWGKLPTLEAEPVNISRSMFFVDLGTGEDTGPSVLSMLMANIGVPHSSESKESDYANLPLVNDICQEKVLTFIAGIRGRLLRWMKTQTPKREAKRHRPGPALDDGDDDVGYGVRALTSTVVTTETATGNVVGGAGSGDAGGSSDARGSSGDARGTAPGAVRTGTGSSDDIGLKNTGDTCYMNAMLISLLTIEPISNFLREIFAAIDGLGPAHRLKERIIWFEDQSKLPPRGRRGSEDIIAAAERGDQEESSAIAAYMWWKTCHVVLRSVTEKVGGAGVGAGVGAGDGAGVQPMVPVVLAFRGLTWFAKIAVGQQDAQEFMTGCFELLEQAQNWARRNGVRYDENFLDAVKISIREEKRYGQTCCPRASDETVLTEMFLSLPLKKEAALGPYLNLQRQIDAFFEQENLTITCEACTTKTDRDTGVAREENMVRQWTIVPPLPKYIVLSLKRFSTQGHFFKQNDRRNDFRASKIDDIIDTNGTVIIEKNQYDIKSCTVHENGLDSKSAAGGHYYALSNVNADTWVKFNDAHVSIGVLPAEQRHILGIGYSYILERRDEAVGVGLMAHNGGRSRLHRLYASLM